MSRARLRIGIMARTLSQKYGVGIYAENFLRALFALDSDHEFVVFLRAAEDDRLPARAGVEKVVVEAPNKAWWDQVAVPLAARRAGLDFLFNTKFTVPLVAPCPTGMCLHGSLWFVHPELCRRLDNLYLRVAMPGYLRAAALLLSNSELTARDHERLFPGVRGKVRVAHLAADERFAPVEDPAALRAARRRYRLPERFYLTVSRGQPRKNLPTLFAALALLPRPRLPLVAAGEGSERYAEECGFRALGIASEVVFPGYVPQEDLAALYSQAEALVFPSVYEEFGIPLVEAMRCGCPIVAARTGALPEVAGSAALFVDPLSPSEIAAAIVRLGSEPGLRQDLIERGLARSRSFSWSRHAREFLVAVEECVSAPGGEDGRRPPRRWRRARAAPARG
jgi:glycosyltransferase involved in cell wall biosynthesis